MDAILECVLRVAEESFGPLTKTARKRAVSDIGDIHCRLCRPRSPGDCNTRRRAV